MLIFNYAIFCCLSFSLLYASADTTMRPDSFDVFAEKYGWETSKICRESWKDCIESGQTYDVCFNSMKANCMAPTTTTTTTTTTTIPPTTVVTEQPTFVNVYGYYVSAIPAKIFGGVTLQECQKACLAYDGDVPCVGVDYVKKNSSCVFMTMLKNIRPYQRSCNQYVIDRKVSTTKDLDYYEGLIEMNVYASNQICPDGYTQISECECVIRMEDWRYCLKVYAKFLKATYDKATSQCIIPPRHCRTDNTTPRSEL